MDINNILGSVETPEGQLPNDPFNSSDYFVRYKNLVTYTDCLKEYLNKKIPTSTSATTDKLVNNNGQTMFQADSNNAYIYDNDGTAILKTCNSKNNYQTGLEIKTQRGNNEGPKFTIWNREGGDYKIVLGFENNPDMPLFRMYDTRIHLRALQSCHIETDEFQVESGNKRLVITNDRISINYPSSGQEFLVVRDNQRFAFKAGEENPNKIIFGYNSEDDPDVLKIFNHYTDALILGTGVQGNQISLRNGTIQLGRDINSYIKINPINGIELKSKGNFLKLDCGEDLNNRTLLLSEDEVRLDGVNKENFIRSKLVGGVYHNTIFYPKPKEGDLLTNSTAIDASYNTVSRRTELKFDFDTISLNDIIHLEDGEHQIFITSSDPNNVYLHFKDTIIYKNKPLESLITEIANAVMQDTVIGDNFKPITDETILSLFT